MTTRRYRLKLATWTVVREPGAPSPRTLSGPAVVAGGLLYVYDPDGGGLRVLRPTTGALVATLPAGAGHWNSPIVVDGRIALPEGDANKHRLTGVLDIWR